MCTREHILATVQDANDRDAYDSMPVLDEVALTWNRSAPPLPSRVFYADNPDFGDSRDKYHAARRTLVRLVHPIFEDQKVGFETWAQRSLLAAQCQTASVPSAQVDMHVPSVVLMIEAVLVEICHTIVSNNTVYADGKTRTRDARDYYNFKRPANGAEHYCDEESTIDITCSFEALHLTLPLLPNKGE